MTSAERARVLVLQVVSVLALLGIWEGAARAGWVDPLFVPAPSAVVGAFGRIGPSALAGLADTLAKTAVAYVLSVVLGVSLGVAVGSVRVLREVSGPLPLEEQTFTCAYGVDVLHHVDDPVRVLRELRAALAAGAPCVFLEGNPRFPITALIGLLQKEERGLFKMSFRNLRSWLAEAGFEDVQVEYGPLYTPPGPQAVVPVLDRIDRLLARTPVLRGLTIFFTAQGRAPSS